jgi:hypothetical protein
MQAAEMGAVARGTHVAAVPLRQQHNAKQERTNASFYNWADNSHMHACAVATLS